MPLPARSESPNPAVADSPSSSVSDLSSPESNATSVCPHEVPQHILVTLPPCDSPAALDGFLRSLPLESKREGVNQYLMLVLSHENEQDGANPWLRTEEMKSLSDAIAEIPALSGDSSSFTHWSWVDSDAPLADWAIEKCSKSGYFKVSDDCDSDGKITIRELEGQLSGVEFGLTIPHIEALRVFAASGLHLVYCTGLSSARANTLYMLERAPFSFPSLQPLLSSEKSPNPFGPPTREEWRRLWAAWDLVTLGMIPPEMLHQKPIDLRHKCLFYIGHIPTFLDMLLSHLFKEPYTEPKNFTRIFERGIDPHVDDPEYCHSHSEVPEADEDWPALPSVLEFRDRVRSRLMRLYDDLDAGKRTISRRIARVLQMTLEHEGFHIETLLYMLIQRAGTGTLPPPGFTTPPWEALKKQWAQTPPPTAQTVTLGPAMLEMGHDDSEADDLVPEFTADVYNHEFGWDNESPKRAVEVGRFKIDMRPITNGEFHAFWKAQRGTEGDVGLPASWVCGEGSDNISVRTVYGPVPLPIAEHWPVLASYEQVAKYAQTKGGRIPTEPELRLFFDEHEGGFDAGANVGFRNWHPVPATVGWEGQGLGKGSNGGVWEWTSTSFDGHAGLAPTTIFPGYSSDFFDGKHQVVLGASYATIPRLAGRRTVRNFYQYNYPYAWVGARVCYDS